ncbi:39S ribosomal protein L39, mitochondrial [Amphibalanus amphitrite]|uniref:Large ribosomal subunit protein mL39 n=1 Tax=Amphibalanus amphitrite TaxID=1232801 RepID=A0A6A4WR76_AMPAM|nr:39S ribosomal protein L39, mitochondrial-like [Amphibalanus amphitrite]XP_043221668.1 39S ribosomal protein L39, mitochondrial-like [Amphibalanus amphitrite]XP_043221669.1 39S ribosomal protein L39, mitochondrial-like [Amphibalanus amphitrite]XP_043221670.1 39S ribosomal protein L39, mitochondrial-like [Amphibalanus amphitrite]XP_043221671.1 39S ribosomal protein L39, mitochondrial-like [Amphibalanus amphitrite]XP_043221672.1 39S ribosomal protein L39, mitochondrial-like [Amphibalanus amphi
MSMMALNFSCKALLASLPQKYHKRCLSQLTNSAVCRRRALLFDEEEKRQRSLVGRVQKMEVNYEGAPENCTLVMNQHLSTPHDCAKHLSEAILQKAALAEVDGRPWDMHRPLSADSCTLRYLYFKDAEPFAVNKAFWRSCSLMLGAVVEEAFKDQYYVQLHSFPSPNVRSGSFLYDVQLPLDSWQPTDQELRVLSGMMRRLAQRALPFRRLEVPQAVALEMFAENEFKRSQVPSIAQQSETGDRVTVYRCGDHVDLSRGPAISHTGLLGRCSICAVHRIEADSGPLYRFQGVALPSDLMLNHFAFGLLEDRARHLNPSGSVAASGRGDTAAAEAASG